MEVHLTFSVYLCCLWPDPVWIFDPLTSSMVKHVKQSPVDINREWEFIEQSKCFALTYPSRLSECKIDKVLAKSDISVLLLQIDEHLFMKNDLTWVINRDLLIDLQMVHC